MSGIKQIDDVVGIDRMDSIDRKKLSPVIKIKLLCEQTKILTGQDPRSGGFKLVGRPALILQILMDLRDEGRLEEVRLGRPIVIGTTDADIVGYWQDIPLIVRCTLVGNDLRCLRVDQIPESQMIDRRRAGELRIHAHAGTLERCKEIE